DPPPPSTRLSKMGSYAMKIAEQRRCTLPALAAELRRELEWIPLKAMRKDRTERYGTATELADDVRNYLSGRPLMAGPETTSYKLRKFVRRNLREVVAAAACLAVLLGLLVALAMAKIGR